MSGDAVSWVIRNTTGASFSRTSGGLVCEGVPEKVCFALPLGGHVPQGIVEFHLAFKAEGQREGAGKAIELL